MKITLVGPGIMQIPPLGWGAVEILVWDTKNALEKLGHQVQIVNTNDTNRILSEINSFSPDFVHIHYDDYINMYHKINFPKAITSHFGYLERRGYFGGYGYLFNSFLNARPNIFCLSEGIRNVYESSGAAKENLFVTPNGVDLSKFRSCVNPKYPDRSIYLAKIDFRKRQHQFQSIPSLWYAGNIADNRFNTSKNYLGEWRKETLYNELTEYGNLVLLSDGEAHPLVCMEALAAGLGVVVTQWGAANLDIGKDFITVIQEDKISDLKYIEDKIIENRNISLNKRSEILEYSKNFDWVAVLQKYHLPSMELIISRSKSV